ncbi:MAG: CPBP family intramembrane metalloprotease [Acidobacteria bacterium]|nr:CPBP family intramembrane metalloprotease [Acidobacteriota bacterium]
MSSVPAGWYPDPWNPQLLRYWDGRAWTPSVAGPDRGPDRMPTLPLRVAVGGVVALAIPLASSRFLLRPFEGVDMPAAVFVAIAALVAYGPTLLYWRFACRRWGSGRLRGDVGFAARLADLGWSPLAWFACLVAQGLLGYIVTVTGVPFESNFDGFGELRQDSTYVVAMVVLAVVVAPFVEEILFRGLILRGLASRMPLALAVPLQAVLFGAAHFDPDRGVGNIGLVMVLTGVGAVLGIAAAMTKRLTASIAAHAMMNGLAMALALAT